MTTPDRPGIADFYEREVLPALTERLDQAFPEFGWQRDPHGWHASNQDFTHQQLGVRADRVVCHGPAPRGFLIHGAGPVLWTTYLNHGRAARGRDFIDAVHHLAERAGVEPIPIHRQPAPSDRKTRLLHDAFVISRHELASERGTNARGYLEQRGIPADRIAETTLGLIPPADELRSDLRRHGYTADELHASGLFADSRWPGRIVGAWRDQHAHVTTLWARAIDADDDRYLYLRGATRADAIPYGLSELPTMAQPSERVEITLVEGVIDIHILRAHGIHHIAALGGTTLTRRQLEQLADLGVDHVILALDNDAAGRAALVRAIDEHIAAARSPALWIIDPDLYGDAKDPADLVRSGGAAAWRSVAIAPICAVTWRALDLTGPIACSNHQLARRAGLNHAEAWLRTLPARLAVEQTAALDTVSTTLGFDPGAVRRAFREELWHHERPGAQSTPTLVR